MQAIEADEIWSFVYSKQRNVPEELQGQFGVGDVWTWTALDADSKLIVCWHVGGRANEDAAAFMGGVEAALSSDDPLVGERVGGVRSVPRVPRRAPPHRLRTLDSAGQ